MTTVQEDMERLILRMERAAENTGNSSFEIYSLELNDILTKLNNGLGL